MLPVDAYLALFVVRHPDVRDSSHAENEQPVMLTFLPFFHAYGMITGVIFTLAGGRQIIWLPRYLLKEVLHCIEKYKVCELFMFLQQFCLNHHLAKYQVRHRRRFWHATLRLRSAIRRHHPPQRAVLSETCCFRVRKVVVSQILLDGAEPRDVGTFWLSSPVRQRGDFQDPLGICVVIHARSVLKQSKSAQQWIITVNLGCYVSLRTSSFRTNGTI